MEIIGANIVESFFHRFSPHGVSGVVIISESHATIHTWPEHGYAAIDIFFCRRMEKLEDGINHLKMRFRSQQFHVQTVERNGRSNSKQANTSCSLT